MDTKEACAAVVRELVGQLGVAIRNAERIGLRVELSQLDISTIGSPGRETLLSVVVTQEVA